MKTATLVTIAAVGIVGYLVLRMNAQRTGAAQAPAASATPQPGETGAENPYWAAIAGAAAALAGSG